MQHSLKCEKSHLVANLGVVLRQLAEGKKLDEIIESIGEVAEGVKTLQIVKAMQKYGYRAPLAEILYKIVFEDLAIKKGIDFLMRFSSDKDAEYIVS